MISIASPATFQFIIGSCSWIVLARLVAETGHSTASAGYQTAIRVVIFFILPAWGMSNAAATLVGQNLGALQPEHWAESVMKTAKYNAVFMGLVSLIFLFGAYLLLAYSPMMKQWKILRYRRCALLQRVIFSMAGMVMANAFNGAGDNLDANMDQSRMLWFFQIPLAYALQSILKWVLLVCSLQYL